MNPRLIILIGPRGSGKTTVGRLLARRLGVPFVDADGELETRAGRSIREIFASEGEEPFRALEAEVLAELLDPASRRFGREDTALPTPSYRDPIPCGVLATGGGAVLRPENRELLRRSGFVVWLTGSVDVLWRRLQDDAENVARRPNLSVGGPVEIADVLRRREPFYLECANQAIDTDNRSPDQIAADILLACKTFF